MQFIYCEILILFSYPEGTTLFYVIKCILYVNTQYMLLLYQSLAKDDP